MDRRHFLSALSAPAFAACDFKNGAPEFKGEVLGPAMALGHRLRTAPYHAYVPSFGEWGYIIAGRGEFAPPAHFAVTPRSFDGASLKTMFAFAPDMARVPVEVNRLNNQILVRYFEEEWRRVMR